VPKTFAQYVSVSHFRKKYHSYFLISIVLTMLISDNMNVIVTVRKPF